MFSPRGGNAVFNRVKMTESGDDDVKGKMNEMFNNIDCVC